MIKVSIITINYNDVSGLHRTFESVFKQTFKNFEYIVVDGGSTDGSKSLIEQNVDRINHWVSEQDNGIYNAMNKGILMASGEYIIFVNSGDELYDQHVLEGIIPNLNNYDINYGNLEYIYANNEKKIHTYPNDLNFEFFLNQSIGHPGTFIRRKMFNHVGLYDENLKISSDWKWFFVAICLHNATYKYINTTISKFYYDGISSNVASMRLIEQEKNSVYKTCFSRFPTDYHEIKNDYKLILNSRSIKLLRSLGFLKFLKNKH